MHDSSHKNVLAEYIIFHLSILFSYSIAAIRSATIMLKLSVLVLLIATTLQAVPSFAQYPWRRGHRAQDSDMSNDVSFVPPNRHHARHHEAPRALSVQESNEEPKVDEVAQEKLQEVYDNLADHILQETSPEHRFEVAKRLTEGSKREWSSIGEFLQYWSKMITELKKENETQEQIDKVVEDEYDNEIIE
ncbi:uncharacterized protein LOC100116801 [Nasonia vitripennis]|uniref:Uncharacterized protein n=1 Tax=Nasonia vitripennis TaxID=7425 RepID=A0A7M7GEC7_NASVI|nr:uncharacterized protein LOC100116801 [Nasonia vitripennis]